MTFITNTAIPELLDFAEGVVILFDKPEGMTSFDVIRGIRKSVKIRKIGHAGTLDPLATGLLILCTGKRTKTINQFQQQEKVYSGEMFLGGVTASYDRETEVMETFDISGIKEQDIISGTTAFTGVIDQYPPIFSALKVGGERLYKKAHRGETVEIKSRKVEIKEFVITDVNLPLISFYVRCSKGTYIRALAYDFGRALGAGAYLQSLRRLQIGDYNVKDAVNFELFKEYLERSEIKSL